MLVLTCSTRPGALGPSVAQWFTDTVGPDTAELVPVALADLDLPFLDEEEHPSTGVYRQEHTRRWSAMVDAADGFVVVTPEYNYGMPAALKNALDYLSREWAWKPIGFVSYGHTSAGTRAVQHAKQVVTTLRMVPLGATVAIRIGTPADPARDAAAVGLLDELVRLAHALRPMRRESSAGPLPGSRTTRLTADDAADVTVLQRCCWVDEALQNDTLDIPALHESVDEVRAWLPDWTTTGLWIGGRLVGMVRTRRTGTDWHIGRLAVTPDLRGRGVGRWLLHTAESAADPDCTRILLSTGAKSHRNIALYQREGYVTRTPPGSGAVLHLAKSIPAGSGA
ncbi:bifunctional NAD(P)H-dependent oxidoreductase/GNAT family N-acetyltransferase [Actinoplanes couchii]|uniref:FMN reductase n=1 Tax=Actinoplanes couchii TaxID=403638 RepID=A0ABQ3XNL9_9ACTN|nr:FMN reductase [Actinoplanes couchii]